MDRAAQDFEQLQRAGYVQRADLRPEQSRRWRQRIAGHAHGNGQRVQTGYLRGVVWAALVAVDDDPGRAFRPPT